MSDTPKKESTANIGLHRLIGLALVPLLIFALLSVLTYDWRDISCLQTPPNHPPANLIGLAGAWATFFGYNLFGLGVWMVPVWLAAAATMLILGRTDELWSRTGWAVVFLLALCALLQLAGGMLEGTLEDLNIEPNAGGAIGNWLMTCSLERWLSPVGGGLLALAVLLFTGVMAVGPARISALARGMAQVWRAWRQQRVEAAEQKAAACAERDRLLAEQERAALRPSLTFGLTPNAQVPVDAEVKAAVRTAILKEGLGWSDKAPVFAITMRARSGKNGVDLPNRQGGWWDYNRGADFVVEGSLELREAQMLMTLWLVDGHSGRTKSPGRFAGADLEQIVEAAAAWLHGHYSLAR